MHPHKLKRLRSDRRATESNQVPCHAHGRRGASRTTVLAYGYDACYSPARVAIARSGPGAPAQGRAVPGRAACVRLQALSAVL